MLRSERQQGRTGRTSGSPPNRAAILDAARNHFARRGYDRATMREIASDAGVDPALLYHYFGSKPQLLVAALALPHDPPQNVGRSLAGGPVRLGERILREFFNAWASDEGALLGLLRSSVTHEEAARMMREFFVAELTGPVAEAAARPQPQLRAALIFAELTGLAMVRFVLKTEPIASASPELLIAYYAPTIDRYLTGYLPGDVGSTTRAH